jgi:hypothetical protein
MPRYGRACDWWIGARAIIGAVEDFIVKAVHVYYRGNDNLIGKPKDYPGTPPVTVLTAQDTSGYAESMTGVQNNIIGLCKLFFEKSPVTGSSTMNLTGKDSVGGTLVHELSHNLCGTLDHHTADDSATCYGTVGCLALATNRPSRAWYNADNIEYFAEDVHYKFTNAPPPTPVMAGTAVTMASAGLKATIGATLLKMM